MIQPFYATLKIFLISVCLVNNIVGQNTLLFSSQTQNLSNLSSIQQQFIAGFNTLVPVIPAQLATIPNFVPFIGQTISGSLIGSGGVNLNFSYTVSDITYNNAGDYIVFGISNTNVNGGFGLRRTTNGVGGLLEIDGNSYLMLPLGGDNIVLLNHQFDEAINYTLDQDDMSSGEPIGGPDYCNYLPECGGIINILGVITQATLDYWYQLNYSDPVLTLLSLFIVSELYTNYALFKSEIAVRVHFTNWNVYNFISTGDIDDDMIDLENDSYISGLRLTNNADLVLLFVKQGYMDGPNKLIAGTVHVVGGNYINGSHIIIDATYFNLDFTVFAHEIGHTMGGRHNKPYDNFDNCTHGYSFNPCNDPNKGAYSTIMAVGTVGKKILNYSNPAVAFSQCDIIGQYQFTGNSSHNNADRMKEHSCQVIKFHIYNELKPHFTRNYTKVCSELNTFSSCIEYSTPSTSCVMQEPFTFLWYWNTDPELPRTNLQNYLLNVDDHKCYEVPISAMGSNVYFYMILQIVDNNNQSLEIISDRIEIVRQPSCNDHTWQLRKPINENNSIDPIRKLVRFNEFIDSTVMEESLVLVKRTLLNIEGKEITNMNLLNFSKEEIKRNISIPGIYIVISKYSNGISTFEKVCKIE